MTVEAYLPSENQNYPMDVRLHRQNYYSLNPVRKDQYTGSNDPAIRKETLENEETDWFKCLVRAVEVRNMPLIKWICDRARINNETFNAALEFGHIKGIEVLLKHGVSESSRKGFTLSDRVLDIVSRNSDLKGLLQSYLFRVDSHPYFYYFYFSFLFLSFIGFVIATILSSSLIAPTVIAAVASGVMLLKNALDKKLWAFIAFLLYLGGVVIGSLIVSGGVTSLSFFEMLTVLTGCVISVALVRAAFVVIRYSHLHGHLPKIALIASLILFSYLVGIVTWGAAFAPYFGAGILRDLVGLWAIIIGVVTAAKLVVDCFQPLPLPVSGWVLQSDSQPNHSDSSSPEPAIESAFTVGRQPSIAQRFSTQHVELQPTVERALTSPARAGIALPPSSTSGSENGSRHSLRDEKQRGLGQNQNGSSFFGSSSYAATPLVAPVPGEVNHPEVKSGNNAKLPPIPKRFIKRN